MDSIKYTFKGNSSDITDAYYPGQAFNLCEHSYTFRVRPKTLFWRFGFKLSVSPTIEFNPAERFNTKYKFLYISAGDMDPIGNWTNPEKTALVSYNLDERRALLATHSLPAGADIELTISYNPHNLISIVTFRTNGEFFEKDIQLGDHLYFQVFAWADNKDYELDFTIEDPTNISSTLIEENKKTQSRTLDLSKCGIKEFPEEVTELVWLEELIAGSAAHYDYVKKKRFVSHNEGAANSFSKLPKGLSKLKNLKTLVLGGTKSNPLRDIDLTEIAALSKLEFLCLVFAPLPDITPLARLTNLRQLYLYDDDIDDISPLAALSELQVLRFRSNNIKDLSSLANLTNLTVLRFGRNKVTDITPLAGLKKLQNLTFYSNRVTDISPLAEIRSLENLSFRENLVVDLQPLADLTYLRELDFRSNQVYDISVLSKLTRLEKLYCKKNSIENITALSGSHYLEELDLEGNLVRDISPLSSLRSLQKINFASCPVKKLSPLAEISSLKSFSCENCPIEDYPADVYETGDPRQLRGYSEGQPISMALEKDLKVLRPFKLKKGWKEPPTNPKRDVKLIVLGNSNTGKTNLINFLETQNFVGDRKTTHGLEVHRWLPNEKYYPTLKDISVSIWDFGGQEYYHESYRLFLSSNSMYLLLWCNESNINGRRKTRLKDNEPEVDLEHFEIRYWLDTIRYYSGGKANAPVLLVENKTDDPDSKKRIGQELHDRYGIRDSFHISLQKGTDKNNGRQYSALQNFLSELEYAIEASADKALIHLHWQQIRSSILSLKESMSIKNAFSPFIRHGLWIDLTDFQTVCSTLLGSQLSPDEQYTIPRWLDRGGVIVFFPDIPSLSDKLFLLPDKLAEKIYEVLNQQVLQRGGEFSTENILTGEQQDFKLIFLEIAQHLDLIYPHPIKGKGHFIAPQYLPDTHAIEELFKIASKDIWLSAFWVRIPLFYYKKTLHGLLVHFAGDQKTSSPYFWKHGILFIKNGLRVLIKGLYPNEDEREGTLLISVEKDAQRQQVLQKEVFDKFFEIIKPKAKNSSGSKVEFSVPDGQSPDNEFTDLLNLTRDINVQVSYDGINYIEYNELLKNAKEAKIKALNANIWLIMKNFSPILPFSPPRAKKVFLSYSHQNTSWLNRLRIHLAGLRRAKEIETWDDKELLPGDPWDASIKKSLEEADVFILLLSADFIASDYIWNEELNTAIQKFRSRSALVIPILFEPLDLGSIPNISISESDQSIRINDFEIAPKTAQGQLQAVSLWANPEEAMSKIAEKIRQAIQKQ